jgi:hypothetical protein
MERTEGGERSIQALDHAGGCPLVRKALEQVKLAAPVEFDQVCAETDELGTGPVMGHVADLVVALADRFLLLAPDAAIFWGLLFFSERGFGDRCANLLGDGCACHAERLDMFSLFDASRRLPRP